MALPQPINRREQSPIAVEQLPETVLRGSRNINIAYKTLDESPNHTAVKQYSTNSTDQHRTLLAEPPNIRPVTQWKPK